jgi:8-oxo-dGTP pyrophosphatase MutT (NUDIX family)
MSEKRNGDFIIKSSVEKYKNPWIKVVEEKVIRPDGKPGMFGIVEMVSGISILPIDDEGYVYLTKEFHYAIGENDIEVVSGAIDKAEKPLEAAKRELKEELGIEAEDWIDLGLINPFTTVIKSSVNIFLARKLKFGVNNWEETENIELVKIKVEEAVRMVMDSVIMQGSSCVLIMKAYKFLNQ